MSMEGNFGPRPKHNEEEKGNKELPETIEIPKIEYKVTPSRDEEGNLIPGGGREYIGIGPDGLPFGGDFIPAIPEEIDMTIPRPPHEDPNRII